MIRELAARNMIDQWFYNVWPLAIFANSRLTLSLSSFLRPLLLRILPQQDPRLPTDDLHATKKCSSLGFFCGSGAYSWTATPVAQLKILNDGWTMLLIINPASRTPQPPNPIQRFCKSRCFFPVRNVSRVLPKWSLIAGSCLCRWANVGIFFRTCHINEVFGLS